MVQCAAKPGRDQVADPRRARKCDEISIVHQGSPSPSITASWVTTVSILHRMRRYIVHLGDLRLARWLIFRQQGPISDYGLPRSRRQR